MLTFTALSTYFPLFVLGPHFVMLHVCHTLYRINDICFTFIIGSSSVSLTTEESTCKCLSKNKPWTLLITKLRPRTNLSTHAVQQPHHVVEVQPGQEAACGREDAVLVTLTDSILWTNIVSPLLCEMFVLSYLPISFSVSIFSVLSLSFSKGTPRNHQEILTKFKRGVKIFDEIWVLIFIYSHWKWIWLQWSKVPVTYTLSIGQKSF